MENSNDLVESNITVNEENYFVTYNLSANVKIPLENLFFTYRIILMRGRRFVVLNKTIDFCESLKTRNFSYENMHYHHTPSGSSELPTNCPIEKVLI